MRLARDQCGFTFLELIVTSAIATGVATMLYGIFAMHGHTMRREQGNTVAQDRARLVIDEMVRALQLAGLDPRQTGGFGFLETTPTRVRFTADVSGDGVLQSGAMENRGFRFEGGALSAWGGGGSWRRLTGDVEMLDIVYLDALGQPTTLDTAIREIEIALRLRSSGRSPGVEPRAVEVRGRVYLRNRA